MKCGLPPHIIQKINLVFENNPEIDRAVIYGSRAKGNYRSGSDIDMTLVGGSDLNSTVLHRVMNEMDDLLLPYSLDLSIFGKIGDSDVVEHINGSPDGGLPERYLTLFT
jgi:predicted nucleotidyltransferase